MSWSNFAVCGWNPPTVWFRLNLYSCTPKCYHLTKWNLAITFFKFCFTKLHNSLKRKKNKYVSSTWHTSLSEFILALKCGLLSIFKATSSLRSSTPDTMFCQSLMHNSLRVVNKSNTSPTACKHKHMIIDLSVWIIMIWVTWVVTNLL